MRFKDRSDAGRQLAELLDDYREQAGVIILALPRGGVPVGFEIARALDKPLDIIVVRKLGVPGYSELAMGAIASGGITVRNDEVVDGLRISDEEFQRISEREQHELERRETAYRGDRPALDVKGKTVILVDNGIATGSTMLAAIRALRTRKLGQIIAAVPVAPREIGDKFRSEADMVVSVMEPDHLYGVGWWYEDFSQTTDEEVRSLLGRADSLHLNPAGD